MSCVEVTNHNVYPSGAERAVQLRPDGTGYHVGSILISERGNHTGRLVIRDAAENHEHIVLRDFAVIPEKKLQRVRGKRP